jgi:peptidyl-prolyl cis-trans isomerase D
MAQKAGREKLALLEQGKSDKDAGIAFAAPVTLKRDQSEKGFAPDALTKIFQANTAKLPQYTGVVNETGGFSIYKVLKVIAPESIDVAKINAATSQIGDEMGRELLSAYVATLKAKSEVKINQANLEKK